MKSNIGTVDSVVRIVLGLAMLTLLFLLEGNLRYIGLLGIVFLATGVVKICPLYMPFGLSTCRTVPEKR
jgi:hypothetical protein